MNVAMSIYIVISVITILIQFLIVIWLINSSKKEREGFNDKLDQKSNTLSEKQDKFNTAILDVTERQLVTAQNQTEVTKNLSRIVEEDLKYRNDQSLAIMTKLSRIIDHVK